MIKKIVNTFGTNVIVAVLNLLIAVIISQWLGAAGKGEQSIIITTVAFILLVCNIMGGASLVYLVPRTDNFKIIIPAYVWSLVVCFVVYFLSENLSQLSSFYNFHICLLTFISSLTAVNSMILLGHQKIEAKNLVAVLQTAVLIISLLILFLFFHQKNITSYIIALYVSFTSAFILSCFLIFKFLNKNKEVNTPLKKVLWEMLRFGFLNQLSHITQLLSFRLSYYILLLFLGKDSVGVYSNAVSLVEAVWLISKSIATVQYARIANSDDDMYARQLTQKLLKSALFMSFLILIPMMLIPSSFYTFVFGKDFTHVNILIIILAPGVFFYNFSLIIGHYFSGKARYHINTMASASGLLVTVVLCLLLIPLLNVYGAAVAAVCSFITTSAVVFYVFHKETRLTLDSFFPHLKDINEYKSYFFSIFNKNKNY